MWGALNSLGLVEGLTGAPLSGDAWTLFYYQRNKLSICEYLFAILPESEVCPAQLLVGWWLVSFRLCMLSLL